jgi:hypothetical protein
MSAILSVASVFFVPGRVEADWAYEYQENFSTDNAAESDDTYFHSIFWPQGAYPPTEPYLYYHEEGSKRELGFGDHLGVEASLSYRFPIGSDLPRRAINGSLRVSVRLPDSAGISASGYLLYKYSADGINWSTHQQLSPGVYDIGMESVRGTCYITFLGTGVLIDDLSVDLFEYSATIRRVPQEYSTIQRAIDAARYGDIVEVAPGTYSDDGNWDIDFRGRSITVRSASGPGHTTIDCQGSHRAFYFRAGEGPDSVLRGFTIINGFVPGSEIPSDNASWNSSPTHPVGGGIYCEFSGPSIIDCVIKRCTAEIGGGIGCVSASPTIIDCVIQDCRAGGQGPAESGGFGAGIGLIRDSEAELIDCQIKDNMAHYNSLGGGVYCWQSQVRMMGCTIASNSAAGNIKGGGFYAGGSSSNNFFESDIILKNCIISKNTADMGGGVFIGSSPWSSMDSIRESVEIVNCTIANNNLSGGHSTYSIGAGIHSVSSDIAVRNSIVWDNDEDGKAVMLLNPSLSSPVLYSDVEGGYTGQGNIDTDPLFASAGGNDYHLKSWMDSGRYDPVRNQWVTDYYHSDCIDAGDPQDSVHAEPLPNGKRRINMGAYGGTAEASKGEDATIYHVDESTGSDYDTGLSRSEAFETIQKAVDVAFDNDVIMVWPGVYREQVTLRVRSITIQSADDAAEIRAPLGYAFSFFTAQTSNCVVRNFVITGCGDAGIYCHSSSPVLTNLTITDNNFGVRSEGGADPYIVNCILWNNGEKGDSDLYHCDARYSCVGQADALTPDSGNFRDDPQFAAPSSSANGDYHLKSRNGRFSPTTRTWVKDLLTSPCIDAGNPSDLLGREQKPHGGQINVGAFGGTPFASKSGSSF